MRSGIEKRSRATRGLPDLRERSGGGSRRAASGRHFLLGFVSTMVLATFLRIDAHALGAVLPPRTSLLLWALHLPVALLCGLAAVVAGRVSDRAGRAMGVWVPGLSYALLPLWPLAGAAAGLSGRILLLLVLLLFLILGGRVLAVRRRTSAPLVVTFLLPAVLVLLDTRYVWYLPRPTPRKEAILTFGLCVAAMAIVLAASALVARVGRSTSAGARMLALLAAVAAFLAPSLVPENLTRPEAHAVVSGFERAPRLPADAKPPDIILLSLDTFRRDRTTVYAPSLDTTPNLAALAQNALVFDSAISASPWTLPSHASLFTGLHPSEHGAIGSKESGGGRALPRQASLLAEELGRRGYLTGGFVANSGFLNARYGFGRGFDVYRYVQPAVLSDPWISLVFRATGGKARSVFQRFGINLMHLAPAMDRQALHWIDLVNERAASAGSRPPLFLFVNYMETHGVEYLPFPEGDAFSRDYVRFDDAFEKRQAQAIRASRPLDEETTRAFLAWYDLQVRYLDRALGQLFDALRERGVYQNALVVVWADHGELFGEHGSFGHRTDLFEELVRVPLIIKMPSRADGLRAPVGRSEAYVQSTDLRPFLLRVAGGGGPEETARALPAPFEACFVSADTSEAPEPALARPGGVLAATELFRYPSEAERYPERYERDLRAVYWRDPAGEVLKYTLSSRGDEILVDVSRDPGEHHDLADSLADVRAELARRMATWLEARQPVSADATTAEPEELKALLRSLGYVD